MKLRLAVTVAVLAAALCSGALASAPSKSQALRWAGAVNLRGGELAGFTPAPPTSGLGAPADVLRSNECGAVAPGRDQIAYRPSKIFGKADRLGSDVGVRMVWSSLTVLASSFQAKLEAQGLASRRAINCLERNTRPSGQSDVDVTVTKVRGLVRGATGVRLHAVATGTDGSVGNVYVDVFAVPHGAAVVTLVTMSIQERFGDATERALMKLLKARATRAIPAPALKPGAPELQG